MDGRMDKKQIDGCMDSKKNMKKQMDSWMYGYKNIWMVGWLEKNGWQDRWIYI